MTATIEKLLEEINQKLTDIEKRLKDLEGLTGEEIEELMNEPFMRPNG
ncbi:hypothetical protein LCGC14_2890360 [marine sediment metagenome]|uniref:Uncharacterized protein n=1 Tax=marine sediment metagenome TaxID=412755 RepID=A0A0F8XXP4_9ZZZZ